MANAFTPNGDGVNDVLNVIGINIASYELRIYEGRDEVESINSNNGAHMGWDGSVGGNITEGIYDYVLEVTSATDGELITFDGSVCLMLETLPLCPCDLTECLFETQVVLPDPASDLPNGEPFCE